MGNILPHELSRANDETAQWKRKAIMLEGEVKALNMTVERFKKVMQRDRDLARLLSAFLADRLDD